MHQQQNDESCSQPAAVTQTCTQKRSARALEKRGVVATDWRLPFPAFSLDPSLGLDRSQELFAAVMPGAGTLTFRVVLRVQYSLPASLLLECNESNFWSGHDNAQMAQASARGYHVN